ncbi:unnamed protein product (macronuclear) [Paramecium tetraurelia]|uniref:Uncharacterized protein n=1 Tax=Paramecium tetraurelia TaxID=5888 RepID=A0DRV1_PARTE|nr:uncharacterized protein GSPATT00039726001 [Paramecium tetraurelia]CAK85768.1 unnamed protein product [Paramecium tetraurelia]|eukprot:XP_001453165.1 hypothetical protein (macronuclear) [Paramecium tetraurelia strain d4-2]
MKYIYYNPYTQYDECINVHHGNYQSEIWDLIVWGVQNQEPMGIQQSFKFRCEIGRIIQQYLWFKMPEYLAKLVADFYKFEVGDTNSQVRKRWIESMEIVNDISTNKVYSHINDEAFVLNRILSSYMQSNVSKNPKEQVEHY